MTSLRSQMNCAIAAFNDCQAKGAFPQSPQVRWWANEVTDFGTRLDAHKARIESQLAHIEALLAEYRSIGA